MDNVAICPFEPVIHINPTTMDNAVQMNRGYENSALEVCSMAGVTRSIGPTGKAATNEGEAAKPPAWEPTGKAATKGNEGKASEPRDGANGETTKGDDKAVAPPA